MAALERAGRGVDDHMADDRSFDGEASFGDAPDALAPWTLAWTEALWRCLQAEMSGRAPEHLGFSHEQETEAKALLDRIEAAAIHPALLGGVGILAELLRPMPDLRIPSWAIAPGRLMAALAVGRACRLPAVWLPMACALQSDRIGTGIAVRGRAEDWLIWLADAVAETAQRERRRAAALDQAAESWRRRVGARRRNSRLPDMLDLLFDEPAFTVRGMQMRLGTTFRGAQLLVGELTEAGIVREATDRALDRVFVAIELIP
jgi:hypothetical protein